MGCSACGCQGSQAFIPEPETKFPVQDKQDFESSLQAARSGLGGPGAVGGAGNASDIDALTGTGSSATALDGKVTISGFEAERVAQAIETLYEKSPTFKAAVDEALANGETVNITTNSQPGGGHSGVSSLGAGNETMTLNIGTEASDESVLALTAHEFGHAFGGHRDGAMGSVGANQEFNSQIGYELGYLGSPAGQAYGTLWG